MKVPTSAACWARKSSRSSIDSRFGAYAEVVRRSRPSAAYREIASIVTSPMPRRGRLMIRRRAISSAGFETAIRYARASLISARS